MITYIPRRYSQPKWQAKITEPEKQFRLSNGLTIASLFELKQALISIPENIIKSHSEEDHHIANWIEHVIKDTDLADQMKNQHHRWGMIVTLERQQMRTLNLPPHVANYWLRQVDNPFTFVNGDTANSIAQLASVLGKIDDESIDFHLEREPNDIAIWIENVLGDYELSELVEESSNRAQMLHFVEDHLVKLRESAE